MLFRQITVCSRHARLSQPLPPLLARCHTEWTSGGTGPSVCRAGLPAVHPRSGGHGLVQGTGLRGRLSENVGADGELSDRKTPHFENLSIWRAVRDSNYIPWLRSLGGFGLPS